MNHSNQTLMRKLSAYCLCKLFQADTCKDQDLKDALKYQLEALDQMSFSGKTMLNSFPKTTPIQELPKIQKSLFTVDPLIWSYPLFTSNKVNLETCQ